MTPYRGRSIAAVGGESVNAGPQDAGRGRNPAVADPHRRRVQQGPPIALRWPVHGKRYIACPASGVAEAPEARLANDRSRTTGARACPIGEQHACPSTSSFSCSSDSGVSSGPSEATASVASSCPVVTLVNDSCWASPIVRRAPTVAIPWWPKELSGLGAADCESSRPREMRRFRAQTVRRSVMPEGRSGSKAGNRLRVTSGAATRRSATL
jgi:hypothetical protein